jgi:hypothetical protein
MNFFISSVDYNYILGVRYAFVQFFYVYPA